MVGRSYIVEGSIYLTLTTGLCTGLGVMPPAASLASVVALSTFGMTPALGNLSHSGAAPLPTTTVPLASPVPTPVVSPTVAAMVLPRHWTLYRSVGTAHSGWPVCGDEGIAGG